MVVIAVATIVVMMAAARDRTAEHCASYATDSRTGRRVAMAVAIIAVVAIAIIAIAVVAVRRRIAVGRRVAVAVTRIGVTRSAVAVTIAAIAVTRRTDRNHGRRTRVSVAVVIAIV